MKSRADPAKQVNTETMTEAKKEPVATQTLPSPGDANALNTNRKFYRDPPYGNLMFDPRVCRGSPFALSRTTRPAGGDARPVERPKREWEPEESPSRPLTPPPVYGRNHASVQTERYLEMLFDRPTTAEVACQTDFFMDRHRSPWFVAQKVGEDEETQIYPLDLWHFDREVHPVVEVLVGRTLEMAMMETLEEDEIENMKTQQRKFEELREGERAEQRRLEEQERQLREEKERCIAQFREALRLQQETAERIAAAVLTQGYLGDLLPNVLEGLTHAGYLLEDVKADMQQHVIPWLAEDVDRQMEVKVKVNDIMTSVLRRIVEARALTYRLLGEEEDRDPRHPPPSSSEGGGEYVKDMGPEEREPKPEPDIP